jgi:hypothetical protein
MKRIVSIWVATLGVAIMVGCKSQDQPSSSSASSASYPSSWDNTANTSNTSSGSSESTASAHNPSNEAQSSGDQTARTASETVSPTNSPSTQPAGSLTDQAQKLIDQGYQYIKENKMDLAEKSLTKLEEIKPQLPASFSPKIDSLRSAFNAAKSGSGNLGGFMGGSQ